MTRDIFTQAYGAMRHDLRKLCSPCSAWPGASPRLCCCWPTARALDAQFATSGTRFGATAVGIYPGRTSQQAGGNKAGAAVRFTNEDIELIRNVVPLAKHVSRTGELQGLIQNGSRTFNMQVFGIDPSLGDIWALQLDEGRFLDEADNLSHSHCVVLGSEAKDKLFSGMQALARTSVLTA